jgi:peptidylprolyl isomerase/peptidyl-prolyl cis-trans isomerase B (cyclophilin B)
MTNKEKEPIVLIKTNYGNIKVKLYNETPIHRDNFIKLVNQGYYNDLTFHRIIQDFMIQGGDVSSQKPSDSIPFDQTDTLEAEILFPQYFHKRGAFAAARWGDDVNPTKASDAYQFYIVTGEKYITDNELLNLEKQRYERTKQRIYNSIQSANMDTIKSLYREGNKTAINELREKWRAEAEEKANAIKDKIYYTEEQKEIYKSSVGGTPFLDGEYTVFGEVVEGMDVVEKIESVKTNEKDAPLQPVKMVITISD